MLVSPVTPRFPTSQQQPDGLRIQVDPEKHGVKPKQDGAGALKEVYSKYKEMAALEDRDLVTRWSETLTMLLTFAGLLSAVITAFLIASQLQPNGSTDKILIHIAYQLDNTTDTKKLAEEPPLSAPTLLALCFWHASLGCSLMAAFGSLLSKQWVLHYQSRPSWANTIEKQCHLREIRAYGVTKWRMYAIIEALPFLLQLSVFLFYLGLIQSLHSTPILFRITTAFTCIMGAFYLSTLVTGAIFISSPFKSPANEFLLKVVIHLICSPIYFFNIAFLILLYILASPFLAVMASMGIKPPRMGIRNLWLDLRAKLAHYWHDLHYELEQKLAQNPEICAGILFWWIQESKPSRAETDAMQTDTMRAVVDVLKGIPVEGAYRMAAWRGMFGKWCSEVFKALNHEQLPSKTSLIEADLICHLMHESNKGTQLVQTGLSEQHNTTDIEEVLRYMCATIRKGWTCSSEGTTEPQPLSLKEMPPTALAIYLHLQLLKWDDVETKNRTLLLQELPIVLEPDYFPNPELHVNTLIDAVALAAIAVPLPNGSPHSQQTAPSTDLLPLDRLFQALYRISYFPTNHPNRLVSLVVTTTARVIVFKNNTKELYTSRIWSDGELSACMHRLMLLGQTWWHAESGTDQAAPGASLVRAVQTLMTLAIDHGITRGPTVLSNMLPISQGSLKEVFDMYAHPQAPPQTITERPIEATKLVNFVLTSRFTTYTSPKRTFRRTVLHLDKPPKYIWSTTSNITLPLTRRTHILRQLIHDLDPAPTALTDSTPSGSALRRASLTIVVMGRDIFLPASVSTIPRNLTLEIERLASGMTNPDKLIYELTEVMFSSFRMWDELLQALGDLLRSLEQEASRGSGI